MGDKSVKAELTVVGRIRRFIEFWYYQYLLVTALYMLEAWERRVFNCFLIAFLAMASYTAYLFLPGHIVMLGHFAQYLFSGLSRAGDPSQAAGGTVGAVGAVGGPPPGTS